MVVNIGTLQESSLHNQLKQLYSQPDDLLEERVGNSIIDIVRGNNLIEIQTGNFSALKSKLDAHLDQHPMLIVYPIPVTKSIMRIALDGSILSIRKSPRKGKIVDIFYELVRIAQYLQHPNFALEIAMIDEQVVWMDDGKGSWRRKGWSIYDKMLVHFHGSRCFDQPEDYLAILPTNLNNLFTISDVALSMQINKNLAAKVVYCFRSMGLVHLNGKQSRSYLYSISNSSKI